MQVGAQIEWDERLPQAAIEARQRACNARLGVEIAPHLMHGPVRIRVSEEVTHNDFRTTYTLRATIEPA